MDTLYFSRCARWVRADGELRVLDEPNRRFLKLEPWSEVVFLAASGSKTVGAMLGDLQDRFPQGFPREICDQLRAAVTELQDAGVLLLHEEPRALSPEHVAASTNEVVPR